MNVTVTNEPAAEQLGTVKLVTQVGVPLKLISEGIAIFNYPFAGIELLVVTVKV